MFITVEDLKDYRTTKGPFVGSPHAISLHQRKVSEEGYILYFINIFQYNVSYLPLDCCDRYRFNCEVTLHLPNTFIKITLPVGDYKTITDLEKYISDIYLKLECIPYHV